MSENFNQSKSEARAGNGLSRANPGSSDVIVSEKRRRLAKFAVGAPVLLTLASRPVLANQCLSNMMSGNLSNPTRGQCSKGWSPGGWGQLGGNVHTYSTLGAWNAINLAYGTLIAGQNPNVYSSYTGGATLANVPAILNKGGLPTTTPLREVLMVPQLDQLTRHLVCAYFNALLGALTNSTFKYVLTPQQVLDLAGGAALPSPYTNLQTFLGSTWT